MTRTRISLFTRFLIQITYRDNSRLADANGTWSRDKRQFWIPLDGTGPLFPLWNPKWHSAFCFHLGDVGIIVWLPAASRHLVFTTTTTTNLHHLPSHTTWFSSLSTAASTGHLTRHSLTIWEEDQRSVEAGSQHWPPSPTGERVGPTRSEPEINYVLHSFSCGEGDESYRGESKFGEICFVFSWQAAYMCLVLPHILGTGRHLSQCWWVNKRRTITFHSGERWSYS